MIKILERYIARNIMMATGIIALIFLGILFLLDVLGELKNIGDGDYGFLQVILFALFRMPLMLYQFSPMLVLLGGITGLSLLFTHREIIVMRASGFSIRQVIFSVLRAALLLVLVMSVLGEWLGPNLSYKAEMHKENAQHAGQAVVTASGIWFHIDNNFIHVQRVIGRELLEGVTRYQFDDKHHLQEAYYAKTLSSENNQWQMHDVVKTTFYQDHTRSESLEQSPWNIKFNTNLLSVGLVDADDMPLPKLAKFAAYLQQNGLQARQYQYDYWKRIFQPFASLVMIFLAIPFVLGSFSATTLSWRIFMGVIVGFIFFILNALLGQLCVVYQLPALFAAAFAPGVFAVIGIVLARRLIKY